jgi:hypothetical protein
MVDKVIVPGNQETEDPKHVEAMVAKAEAASEAPVDQDTGSLNVDDRPEWLPEKFNSAEDLAKAYSELESKLGQPKETTQNESKAEQPSDNDVAQELDSRGLDLQEFSSEFSEKGELSQDSYEKLEKAGITRNIVDQYIDGQQALAAQYESDVMSIAGGNEGFSEMTEWARSNLSENEISVYNRAVDSGDIEQARLAVAGVYQKFSAARPNEPSLLRGNTAGPSAGDSYESVAQLTKDMSTPEYKSDPAFRARVQQKLSRSNIL